MTMPQPLYAEIKCLRLPHYVDNPANLSYATPDSVCFDICAAISEPLTLKPGERAAVPTGLKFAPPAPLWFRICSRSGLAVKHGIITVAGIIDSDYRGEVLVALLNTNPERSGCAYTINPGDKIAQVELPFPYKAKFQTVSEQEFAADTLRGANGFGSSGR